jgi:hypothetical protein
MAKKQQQRLGRGGAPSLPAPAPEASIVRANVNRLHEKSPDYFSVYANDVQLQTTPWDVRLILGVITTLPTEETSEITVMQIGDLRMSPQLAKKMTILIFQQLKVYEARFGEIPVTQD